MYFLLNKELYSLKLPASTKMMILTGNIKC